MENIQQFQSRYPYENIAYDVQLQCSMKVGGKVDILITPKTEMEIITAIKLCREMRIPYYVAGNLSNTLVLDGGYHGAVIQINGNYAGYYISRDGISVKSGTSLIKFAKDMTELGYGGLEFAGGIPGTVGGGIYMNAGAYDGEMANVVSAVKVFDGQHVAVWPSDQLEYSYRHSVFMKVPGIVILEGQFKLQAGTGDMQLLTEFNKRRAEKQPLDKPNGGSTFRRPAGGYAAALIEECGLKGLSVGDAQVSDKHSGFIVNNGQASANDVLLLMRKVQRIVKEKKGIELMPEWVILGEE